MQSFERFKIIAVIILGCLSISEAQAVRLDVTKTRSDLNQDVKAKYVIDQKFVDDYFTTKAAELKAFCIRADAGVECVKMTREQKTKLLSLFFRELLDVVPESTRPELLQLFKANAPIPQIRAKYQELINRYMAAHTKASKEIEAASNAIFKRQGFFPMAKSQLALKPFIQKFAASGITDKDIAMIDQTLFGLHLRETFAQVILGRKNTTALLTDDRSLKMGTNDFATKLIVLRAIETFDRTGAFERGDAFEGKEPPSKQGAPAKVRGVNESDALWNLMVDLMAVDSQHGLWLDKVQTTERTGIPKDILDAAKKDGKFMNFERVLMIWEATKGVQTELLYQFVRDNDKATLAQLKNNAFINSISTHKDIEKVIRAVYMLPLLEIFGEDVYTQHLAIKLNSESPRFYYQHKEYLEKAAKRRAGIGREYARLVKQYPGVVTWDYLVRREEEKKKLGIEEAQSQIKKAKENPAPKPTGGSQIKEGMMKLGQWEYNVATIVASPFYDVPRGQKIGTAARTEIERVHRNMSLQFDYSVVGTPKQLAVWNPTEFAIAQIFAPVMSVSSVIGGGMILVEDGWDHTIRSMYGMSPQEYAVALKKDNKIKYLKYGFYVGQGALSLWVVAGTGGAAGPAVAAANGARGAAAATTALGRLRLASSVFLKPMGRRAFNFARNARSPLLVAFGMSGLFAGAQELYDDGTEGDKANFGEWLYATSTGASTTLGFMMYMKGAVFAMNAARMSSSAIARTTVGIDLGESTGDWPHTYQMWKDSRNNKQWVATILMGIGNAWDSGDSAAQVAKDIIGNDNRTKNMYSKARMGILNGVLKNGGRQLTEAEMKLELEENRLKAAVSLLKRPLTAAQAGIIRTFKIDKGSGDFARRLEKAEMTPQEVSKIVNLFSEDFELGFAPVFNHPEKLMEEAKASGLVKG